MKHFSLKTSGLELSGAYKVRAANKLAKAENKARARKDTASANAYRKAVGLPLKP